MKEIPVAASPGKSNDQKTTIPSSNPNESLLRDFEKLRPACRELVRRRIYGLKKRKAAMDVKHEAQRLPQAAFEPEARRLLFSRNLRLCNGLRMSIGSLGGNSMKQSQKAR